MSWGQRYDNYSCVATSSLLPLLSWTREWIPLEFDEAESLCCQAKNDPTALHTDIKQQDWDLKTIGGRIAGLPPVGAPSRAPRLYHLLNRRARPLRRRHDNV